jgi:hypothetical protein
MDKNVDELGLRVRTTFDLVIAEYDVNDETVSWDRYHMRLRNSYL